MRQLRHHGFAGHVGQTADNVPARTYASKSDHLESLGVVVFGELADRGALARALPPPATVAEKARTLIRSPRPRGSGA